MEKSNQNFENNALVEIYKLHCEMADKVSQRRSQANHFYITILSALIGILSLSSEEKLQNYFKFMMIIGGFMGVLLCIIWIVNIRSYRQLNSAKFKALHDLELKLPFQFYSEEWKYLGEGNDSKKYFQLTKIEQFAPVLFSIPFIILIVLGILN